MSFANVDDEDVGKVLIRFVGLLDLTDRGAERRSAATAEVQHDGLTLQLRQCDGLFAVHVL
jgi:hypothetical protein